MNNPEITDNASGKSRMQWQVPQLYTEDWMNTLDGFTLNPEGVDNGAEES